MIYAIKMRNLKELPASVANAMSGRSVRSLSFVLTFFSFAFLLIVQSLSPAIATEKVAAEKVAAEKAVAVKIAAEKIAAEKIAQGTVHIAPGAMYDWVPGRVGNSKGRIESVPANHQDGAKLSGPVDLSRFVMRRYFGLETGKVVLPGSNEKLSEKNDLNKKNDLSERELSLNEYANKVKCDAALRKPAGVFVTLSKNSATRACWGTVYPQQGDIVHEIVFSTLGALTKDYRFKPVRKSELADLKIQVSIIRGITPVVNVSSIDPLRDGIMVRAGGRSGVILPGEAVDAYYEFVLARLKAGIKPAEPCQIYKLRVEIYD